MVQTLAIFAAKELVYIALIVFGLFFLLQSRHIKKRIALLGGVSGVLSFAFAFILRHIYYNPRPFVVNHITPVIPHLSDNGFPSDHTLLTAWIASIAFVFNKKLGVLLWVVAIMVSFSRVYLGLHHAVDVLGSFIIIVLITILIHGFVKPCINKSKN